MLSLLRRMEARSSGRAMLVRWLPMTTNGESQCVLGCTDKVLGLKMTQGVNL